MSSRREQAVACTTDSKVSELFNLGAEEGSQSLEWIEWIEWIEYASIVGGRASVWGHRCQAL